VSEQSQPTDWYSSMPTYGKLFLQFGFAGLIAVLFFLNSREQSTQLRDWQNETRIQAREDRLLFRESTKELGFLIADQSKSINQNTQVLTRAVNEMADAVDQLNTNQKKLKSQVDELKYPFPKPRPVEKE
jgi:hypothetical protein